jgi:predicted MFS family arabinose efflux permease
VASPLLAAATGGLERRKLLVRGRAELPAAPRHAGVVFTVFTAVPATLPLTATTTASAAAVLFVWGMFTWSVNPPIQRRLIELAPVNSGLLLSLNVSAIYLGVGLSGITGGLVVSGAGVLALPPIAASLGATALVLLVLASRRSRTGLAMSPACELAVER